MLLKSGLYIVSTPIGNLEDITFRAINTLKKSDIILCENVSNSMKLLRHYDINTKCHTYNDHSNHKKRIFVKELLDRGCIVSLISDAGTPLISDPGYKLVSFLLEENYYIDVIPGSSSVISALVLSGMPTNNFYFGGFIPRTQNKREKFFKELLLMDSTLVFFETPHRLRQTLDSAISVFGDRKCCVLKEMTKLYQKTYSGNISTIIDMFDKEVSNIKGEIVLIIASENFSAEKNKNYDF